MEETPNSAKVVKGSDVDPGNVVKGKRNGIDLYENDERDKEAKIGKNDLPQVI